MLVSLASYFSAYSSNAGARLLPIRGRFPRPIASREMRPRCALDLGKGGSPFLHSEWAGSCFSWEHVRDSFSAGPLSASAVSSALCGNGILRVSLPMMSEEKPSESIAVSLGDGRNLRGRRGAGDMGNEGGMLAREVDAPAEHAGAAASVDDSGGPHIESGGAEAASTGMLGEESGKAAPKEDAEDDGGKKTEEEDARGGGRAVVPGGNDDVWTDAAAWKAGGGVAEALSQRVNLAHTAGAVSGADSWDPWETPAKSSWGETYVPRQVAPEPAEEATWTCNACQCCKPRSAYFKKWKDWIQPVCRVCCDKFDNATPWWVWCKNCKNEYPAYRFPQIRRKKENLRYFFPEDWCAKCLVARGWSLHDVRSSAGEAKRWVPKAGANTGDGDNDARAPARDEPPAGGAASCSNAVRQSPSRDEALDDIKRAMELLQNAERFLLTMPA